MMVGINMFVMMTMTVVMRVEASDLAFAWFAS